LASTNIRYLFDKKWRYGIKALSLLIVVLATLLSGISSAEEKDELKIMGIILGKSLEEAGMRECREYYDPKVMFKSSEPGRSKRYDPADKNCYKMREPIIDRLDFDVKTVPDLSFPMDLYITLSTRGDLKSPVIKMEAEFYYTLYPIILDLMVSRFGQPEFTRKSTVQNNAGAKFEKIVQTWFVKGEKGNYIFRLSSIDRRSDEGSLRLYHPAALRQLEEKTGERQKTNQEKF
jgi:hypothetical protein